jgi:RNA polymerase sigma-70 factor, ECF subfamily
VATDIELANRIRVGECAAMDELYRRYLPAVWRYAMAQLHPDEAAARDAVGETFLALLREIGRFDPAKGSVAAWLMGIARHKVSDLRRLRIAEELPEDAAADRDPAVPVICRETRAAVTRVMVALEDEHRLVLEWKYLEGLPVRALAQRLGTSEKAVESLLFRARAEFRRRAGFLMEAKGV